MARRELLKAGCAEAISDIAMRCGLSILGGSPQTIGNSLANLHPPPGTRTRRVANGAVAKGNALFADDNTAAPSLAPFAGRAKPSLLILPLRTETLQERMEARDLAERLAATLPRMRVASVALASAPHSRSDGCTTAAECRHAVMPARPTDAAWRARAHCRQAG